MIFYFFNKICFFLKSIYLQRKSKWTENEKPGRRKFRLTHNFVYLDTWLITDTMFSVKQSMISWWVEIFLLLLITFRTNVRMSITPPHVRFCLLFNWNGPLIPVLMENLVQFAYLETIVPL